MPNPAPKYRPQASNQFRAILGSELLQLVRDKRAVFAAIVLPVLLYPWLFFGQNKIEKISKESLASRSLQAAHDLSRLPEDWKAPILEALEAAQPIEWVSMDAGAVVDLEAGFDPEAEPSEEQTQAFESKRRELYKELLGPEEVLLVVALPPTEVRGPPVIGLYYDLKEDTSREAQGRVSGQLSDLEDARTMALRTELLGGDPAAFLNTERVDVASAAQRTGAKLGRLLPMLLVLLLLSGGAFAALTVFAGERESGTLESILVQPIEPKVLALSKFAAVAVAAFVTLLANLLALYLCVAMGWTSSGEGDVSGLNPMSLLGALWYLPGALLLCGLLCLALGNAKTFREGQYLLFPITMLAAIPSAVVLQPSLPNNMALSAIPFTGAALVLRDILRGDATVLTILVMTVSHLLYTAWTVSRLGNMLDGERALANSNDSLRAAKLGPARHGMRWGFAGVLAVYIVGSWIQSRIPIWGIAWTLWGLLPAMAVVCAMRARKPAMAAAHAMGGKAFSLVRELGLNLPSPRFMAGALLLVPALSLGMQYFLQFQEKLLPLPGAFSQADPLGPLIENLSTFMLVFVIAVSPGICEELFFRGAVFSSLRRGMSTSKALFWQTVFFAAAHASVHRLMPTAIIGLLLGVLTLRARSILPAILLHATYNASIVMQGMEVIPSQADGGWPMHLAWLAIPGVALMFWPKRTAEGSLDPVA